ncbi:MAG: response regulator, partial [Bacteroidota bacterium]
MNDLLPTFAVLKRLSMTEFTLLIVDDQPEVVRELVDFFRRHFQGGRVLQTVSPKTALKILSTEHPDLVFTDWDMPELNGIELMQAMQADPQLADIPVILCSGKNIDSGDLYQALSAGAVDYLRKPFDDQELIARVMTALRERKRLKHIRQQAEELADQKAALALEKERNERLLQQTIGFQRKDIETLALELNKNQALADNLISRLDEWSKDRSKATPEAQRALRDLKRQLLSGERLENLRTDLDHVNTAFYNKLRENFPSVTAGDLELCAYARMGLTNKEVAMLRGVSPDSVKRQRNRLRKRLNLPPSVNLTHFLTQLS